MDAAPLGDVAVRFPPLSAGALATNAQQTYDWDVEHHRVPPRFGVSVRADVRHDGASVDDVIYRLCTTAALGGKTMAAVSRDELASAGFVLVSDPDPQDALHHLIGSGDLTEMPDTVRLAALLATHKQARPQVKAEGKS